MSGFVAVDWGTSSFRLWVMAADGAVLGESRGPEGMAHCVTAGFAPVLAAHLAAASAPSDWPVLICGMAGARRAWAEAPYADLPAPVSVLAAQALRLPPEQAGMRDIRILPGLAARDPARPDVMRGEETQLLGLALMGHQGLVCMPGTHCKWARLEAGAVTDFRSFLTGELYELLSKHSILRLGLPESGNPSPDDPAFVQAVDQALADPGLLTEALFPVRASGLLGYATPEAARARLSGLVIGTEIGRMAPQVGADGMTLLGQQGLGALYLAALQQAGLTPRLADAETATRAGLLAAAQAIWSLS
ncbi:2-dehydro-3-deoxygalactonokinase [Pseudogemmobacter bohemicus]|uniref:2-dehydro-3-deoxygalactonokinase n=1 Tax=Pseudogemmobacter bohemicus TaxID=2250708 RepID=UPI000DD4EBF3|nr:2-dehydro-3-deoxygalactonokinase [Pseudogemmobacter bohemicus]